MSTAVSDAYLETQINTATPQRLRLLLIEEAHRRAGLAHAALASGRKPEGERTIQQCREIVAELIAGIRPEGNPVAKRVLGIYLFLFASLAEAQFSHDTGRLKEVLRVLDEERQTWRDLCEQMPQRPVAAKAATEELAPQRVSGDWTGGYEQRARGGTAVPALSIEA